MQLEVIILAAGRGTRMRSRLPKVLHPIGGRPMLAHVIDTALALEPRAVHVVHGHGAERVRAACDAPGVDWVEQDRQLGTGHAVECAMPRVQADSHVLVLYGDVPLTRPDTLGTLLGGLEDGPLALLTMEVEAPTGYGRIVRDDAGQVCRIVEEKDASPSERAITEVNTGILAARAEPLRGWLDRLDADNAQQEYLLTDVVGLAAAAGESVAGRRVADPTEVSGVNNRVQLAALERAYQLRGNRALMLAGVGMADPARVDIRGRLEHGEDVWIDVNVVIEGDCRIGPGVTVGPNCVLRDCELAAGARVESHSVVDGARVGPDCRVGPFARLRPGTRLDAGARVGNFVETKAAAIGEGSKINHLSYVGDAELGRGVNLGAGTITCNYDGHAKHRTVIGDRAFIGSDTQLVAPVVVGAGATVGAGSTITRDVGEGELALSRPRQRHVSGWRRPGERDSEA